MANFQIIVAILVVGMFALIQQGVSQGSFPSDGECKSCDNTIKGFFEVADSIVQGMEPIELNDQSICKKVVITGLSTMQPLGTPCMLSEPHPSNVKWQRIGIRIRKFHMECHIIPLKDFGKALGIPIPPIPSLNIPGLGSPEQPDIIVLDGTNTDFDMEMRLNFEEDQVNITKLELKQGKLDSMQVSLKGSSLFTKLGEVITKPRLG